MLKFIRNWYYVYVEKKYIYIYIKCFSNLYHTNIFPYLISALKVGVVPVSVTYFLCIVLIQKKNVRLITLSIHLAHVEPIIFKSLNIIPLKSI